MLPRTVSQGKCMITPTSLVGGQQTLHLMTGSWLHIICDRIGFCLSPSQVLIGLSAINQRTTMNVHTGLLIFQYMLSEYKFFTNVTNPQTLCYSVLTLTLFQCEGYVYLWPQHPGVTEGHTSHTPSQGHLCSRCQQIPHHKAP